MFGAAHATDATSPTADAAGVAAAGTPRHIAVFSSIGDTLNVISYGSSAAGHTDQNQRQSFETHSTAFDSEALLAAEKAIRGADAGAQVLLLSPGTLRGTAEQQDELFEGDVFEPTKALAATLGHEGATHLLIITKHRGRAALRLHEGNVGSGVLEGLGYYIDQQLWVKSSGTGEVSQGFLAPYAYFKLSFIDLKTSRVIARRLETASTTFAATSDEPGTAIPWNALTADQKTEALKKLISKVVAADVPALVNPPAQ